jgi:hypothetical protein
MMVTKELENWKSGGQVIGFHEIEIIILLKGSGDRVDPRCPQVARLG